MTVTVALIMCRSDNSETVEHEIKLEEVHQVTDVAKDGGILVEALPKKVSTCERGRECGHDSRCTVTTECSP
jgi:hypothetical protein